VTGPSPADAAGALARTDPERRLMLAVLSDAIVILSRHRNDQRDTAATASWVRSDDCAWPYSFVNVCEALGLAHEPLRRALLQAGPGRRSSRRRLLAGKTTVQR
jgi:hypothetical protein